MFNQKATYEKQCVLCKVGSGLFFAGFGAFHQTRMKIIWYQLSKSEKFFNAVVLIFVYGLTIASFNAAYQIQMGKQMALVEMRPSYSRRFSDFYNFQQMDDQQKREYLRSQIQQEEEKREVEKQYNSLKQL